MIRKLGPYLKGYRKYSLLCIICVGGEAVLDILMPFMMSKIVDIGIPGKDMEYVLKVGGVMILMSLISLLLGVISARLSAKAGMGLGSQVRSALFDKVQEFSFSNIDKFSTASLITRCTTDVNNIQNAFILMSRLLIKSPVILVSAMIITSTINRKLVNVFFIMVPFLGISLYFIIKIAFPKFQQMLKKYDSINSSVQENLTGARVVKSFVRAVYEKKKFKDANDALMEASIKAEKIVILNNPILQLSVYGCVVAILWFGGEMIIGGELLTGELISFIAYVIQIMISLMMISMVFVHLILSRASVSRIIEVIEEEVEITDKKNDESLLVKDGGICFKNVEFQYSSDSKNRVLENINLDIRPGEIIGIVGGTGSSKTSLVQLIPRLYDVVKGEVLVGGRNVKEYNLKNLRDSVAMVLQKNVLFSGTIEENIKWGNEDATHEEVVEACKAACAHDFIMSFSEGYGTVLEQGGSNVSGGQKQRLCIARALIKKPRILILDDSTSAVDTATDARIQQAFKENLKGTTTIIIAQRISSVAHADRILVLDEGKINAVDTHEALLKENPIYQEVYYSQQKGALA